VISAPARFIPSITVVISSSTASLKPKYFRTTPMARAFEPRGIKKFRVVGLYLPGAGGGYFIFCIGTHHRSEQDGDVADGARHGARGVLAMRDRDDSSAAYQAQRRFHPGQAVGGRGTDYRSVGLGADAGGTTGWPKQLPPYRNLDPQGLRSRA